MNQTQRDVVPDTNRTQANRKLACKLAGTDGNVFSVIGRVQRVLKEASQLDRASEFVQRAFRAKSYDEVLALCTDYVEVR